MFALSWDWPFINTFADAGNTYFPVCKGDPKKLDYLIGPIDLMQQEFVGAEVLATKGHELQLRNTPKPWDHWPLLATFDFDYVRQVRVSRAPPRKRWKHEELRNCVLRGQLRQDFLTSLGDSLDKREHKLVEQFDEDGVPDHMFQTYLDAVTEAAGKHFMEEGPEPSLHHQHLVCDPHTGTMMQLEPSMEEIRELSTRLWASPQATLDELSTLSFRQILNKHQRLKRLQRHTALSPHQQQEAGEVHWAITRLSTRIKHNKQCFI